MPALAAELSAQGSAAFDQYTSELEARRLRPGRLIHLDEDPAKRAQLRNGEIVIQPAQGSGEKEVPSATIHDWTGTFFLPSVTIARVLSILQDYSRTTELYKPDIVASHLLTRKSTDEFDVFLRIVKSKFLVTDVLNTDHQIKFTHVDATHVYSSDRSTRVAEVTNYGTPKEKELPAGKDRGLLWRINGYWFLEERDGGVYSEYESVTLSRNIPFGMGAVLGPILHNVPAESLRSTLDKTRKAVLAKGSVASNATNDSHGQ